MIKEVYNGSNLLYTLEEVSSITEASGGNPAVITTDIKLTAEVNTYIGINVYIDDESINEIELFTLLPGGIFSKSVRLIVSKDSMSQVIPIRIETTGYNEDYVYNGNTYVSMKDYTVEINDSVTVNESNSISLMSLSDGFNKDLDKITEAEVVYDFVERLRLGRNLRASHSKSSYDCMPAGSSLINVLQNILISLPATLTKKYSTIRSIKIDISQGDMNISQGFIDDHATEYVIIAAYSDKLRMDISTLFGTLSTATVCNVTATFDTPYPYEDTIIVYLAK